MTTLVLLLAVAGVGALIGRLARTAMRAGLRVAEVTAARGLVEISIRRGDLTGLSERRLAHQRARRGRARELAIGAFWVGWMLVPLFTPWTAELYAIASPLLLLRTAPRRQPPG